jgi:chemotaxis protein CheC
MGHTTLTEEQLDALREISNIGMGHAATALSQLMGKTVYLRVPKVKSMEITSIPAACGGAERMIAGIYLQVMGQARGNILMVFPKDNALAMLKQLLSPLPFVETKLTELQISTLKEVGNILASAYLNALGSVLKMPLIPSTPLFSFDMASAVVDYVLVELGVTSDAALMIETEFSIEGEQTFGHFFLLPEPPSLRVILNAIDV